MNETESRSENARRERTPRYASAQDYLRVIRRHRILIAAIFTAFVAGAIAISATQDEVFEARASVNIRDVFSDLRFVPGGGNSTPEQGPAQRAALSAEQITSPKVAAAAQEILVTDLTPGALLSRINTQVSIQTNLVDITASAPTGAEAAATANAFAQAAQKVIPRDVQRRLRATEKNLRDELDRARDDPITSGAGGVIRLQLSQIRTLREISRPVEIARRAAVPTSPVSPKPVRSAILAGLLGLVVGLVVAFLRDSFDRRLRTVHEVHQELGLPVLGSVAYTSFASAGLVSNGKPALESDFEAFRVLRTNLAFASNGQPPRTVLVTSGLPEEGKSTVAVSLASAAALLGQRVLLVECDLRRPSFEARLGVKRAPGLSDYLEGNCRPGDILQPVALDKPVRPNGTVPPVAQPIPKPDARDDEEGESSVAPKLVCIAAGGATSSAAELLAGPRFRDFLDKVSRAYDLVVLDTGPLLAVVDPLEIVPMVDLVLVCARVERTTREEAHATRSALNNLPEKPMGAVVTGLKRGAKDSRYYYSYNGY